MKPNINQIEGFLKSNTVGYEKLCPPEQERISKQWQLVFAKNVKMETGEWIYNRFRWHGFSLGYQKAVEGAEALKAYQSQWPAQFIVFDENNTWSYRCASNVYPDFSSLGADIYVAHQNMKWTIAFTHEQPDIGPFFAEDPMKANV